MLGQGKGAAAENPIVGVFFEDGGGSAELAVAVRTMLTCVERQTDAPDT